MKKIGFKPQDFKNHYYRFQLKKTLKILCKATEKAPLNNSEVGNVGLEVMT